MRSSGAVYTMVRVSTSDSTRPITEKQSDNRCSIQSSDTHHGTNMMTSSGPKAQGKGIMRPGLTGSLLRNVRQSTDPNLIFVTNIRNTQHPFEHDNTSYRIRRELHSARSDRRRASQRLRRSLSIGQMPSTHVQRSAQGHWIVANAISSKPSLNNEISADPEPLRDRDRFPALPPRTSNSIVD